MNRKNSKHRHQPPNPLRDRDPKHEQTLDTVAQKPTDIGLGAPTSGGLIDTDEDQNCPTPGAQPPLESEEASLRERQHVAAGMEAVMESARRTLEEMGAGRGLFLDRCDARQFLSFEVFQHGAAASGYIADLIGIAELVNGRYGIATAYQ